MTLNSIAMTRWSDCIGRTRGCIDVQSQIVLIRRSVVVNTDWASDVNLTDRTEMVSGDCTVIGTKSLLSNVRWLLEWSNRMAPLGCTLILRNLLPLVGGRKRVNLTALGNSGYSITYPRDVTTTNDLVELKCNAAIGSGNWKALAGVSAPSGSMTTCTVESVANAATDEFSCSDNAVIGDPTSDNIVLVAPFCKLNE